MAAIVVGTNSYVTEAELTTYVTDRGITLSGDTSVLLINAMDYIEIQQYKGYRYVDEQVLEFPRSYYNPDTEDAGEVPPDVGIAQMVAAIYIDAGADLNPSIGRAVKVERIEGAVMREFMDNAQAITTYPQLTKLLSYYLQSGSGNLSVNRG